ncbi:NosD domain-containing protein [Methanococcus sp. CF]
MTKVGYKPLIALALAVFVSMSCAYAATGGEKGTNTIYLNDSSCRYICEPGHYVLTENMSGTIKIFSDNVTLDGNGYTLKPKCWDDYGVLLYRCSGVTVKDLQIEGDSCCCCYGYKITEAGISLYKASECMILQNDISKCGMGIKLYRSENNKIVNNVLDVKWKGIYLEKSDCNKIIANDINEEIKIDWRSDYNKVHGNEAEDIDDFGDYNDISGNEITE